MSSRWRYYNSKRGNGFRGRGRGRGRRTKLTAFQLPREDFFHEGEQNEAYFRDKRMNPNEYRDETVLSLSFSQNMLGAAYYEQSTQLVKIMNDISEDHEFSYLKRLIEEVKPTRILVNRSQDLEFIKLLSSKYRQPEKLQNVSKDIPDTSEESIPTWDASLAYSTDETIQEKEEDDEDEFEGPPALLHMLTNNFFKMPKAIERLTMMVGSDKCSEEEKYTIITMRFDLEAVNMMRSFGALLLFLDETRLGVEKESLTVTPPIKSIKTFTLENLVDIDYNTIQALDILPKEVESKKSAGKNQSLFSLVDRCRSTVGKKCLRKWFRNPTTDRAVLVSRQKCVHFFKQDWNAEATAKIASSLGKVKALNNVFLRFQSGTAKLLHWECFVSTINALLEIMGIIRQTTISDELHAEMSLLREVSEVACIAGSIINFVESRIHGRVTVMPGIDDELDKLRDAYENMPMLLTAVAKQESLRLGLTPLHNVTCVYIPLVGFVLSLPRDFPIGSQEDMQLVYATNEELRVRNKTTERLDDDYGDILMKLIDSQTAIILTLKLSIMKKQRSITKLLTLAARIDALVALGLVAAENGWNCPQLVDEPIIEALELYHPISVLVVKKNFVPNQVSSGRNGVKASIITGPNACGKSIYMKSIGILAFLSHIGSFVPARHAKVGLVDRIVTRMFTVDSVLDGMSTFAKDVEQVALALRKATGNSLVIIDEFGKGTMTEVGLSLLASCMTYWMQKGPNHCPHIFLSSHFHSLPKYIPLDLNIATFLTFTVLREPGGQIKYLFRLTPGMVDCSFAMAVAKEKGIPMPIIGRACRIYKAIKMGAPLKEVQAEVKTIDDEEQMVFDMDIVLADDDGFMEAIETFIERDKGDATERLNKSSNSEKMKEIEERDEVVTSISNRHSEKDDMSRVTSALSSRSLVSMDQLSVFDALLPKKKKKVVVVSDESEVTTESCRSPDPFSVDSEEECGSEYNDEKDDDKDSRVSYASKLSVPNLQRMGSEEEINKPSSRNTVSNYVPSTPKIIMMGMRNASKRLRSPSTSDGSLYEKNLQTANVVSFRQESQVPETPLQSSRNSSSRTFVMPKLPSSKNVNRIDDESEYDAMFKTPTTIKKFANARDSHCVTSNRRFNPLSIQTPTQKTSSSVASKSSQNDINNSFNFTNDSIFKSQDIPDSIFTPRSSSRREIRPEDMMKTPQTPKSSGKIHSSYSPVGSNFSIFDSQQSFPGLMTQNSSNNFSSFFGTQNSQNNSKPKVTEGDYTQKFGYETPKNRSAKEQKFFIESSNQRSTRSISPSSVILGDLIGEEIEKTPRPLGDKSPCTDFVFNMDDDDPIYGKNTKQSDTQQFDFLKSNNDDNSFLKTFLGPEKSLKIAASSDDSINRTKRK